MKIIPVKTLTDIAEGDILIIHGHFNNGPNVQSHLAEIVKVTDNDGTEIIFNKKENHFLNLGMYLAGKSWVKSLFKIDANPEPVKMGVDFNGLRRHIVGSYNSLVDELNAGISGETIITDTESIGEHLDDLRDGLATLINIYEEGKYQVLEMHLETFNGIASND